jgi:RNA polymerase sigma-70 factor (ECF subfamily)
MDTIQECTAVIKTAKYYTFTPEIRLERSRPIPGADLELAYRLAEGDTQALQELIAAYGQRMYAFALRLTGDPVRAEDVMQESLVAAWQGAKRFRGSGRLIAWLLGIVHHRAMESFKKPAPVVEDGLGENAAGPAAGGPLLEDQTALSEQRRALRLALRRLSPEHRAVLELVFYQGLSLQETAQVCGVPLGTVKSRLNYAKASLRGVLTRAGFSAEDLE